MKSPSSHRVLVIDDTPAIHDDFRKIFNRPTSDTGGLDAMAATLFGAAPLAVPNDPTEFIIESSYQGRDGAEMVRLALDEGRPYSLAFVDMRMPPGWDGLETVQEIWKIDPRIQIVICTAHSDHSWHSIQKVLGPTDSLIVLKKPFDHIEARQLAHALCQKWALARENETRLAQLDALVRERTQELRVAENHFSRAFAANPHAQALIALDPFEILELNPAFIRQFGLSTADVKGQTPESFGRGIDPSRWRRLLSRLHAGKPVDEYPFVYERSPGVKFELRCSARPMPIGGRPGSIWLVRDVTEQHRLEQQFRQAQKMEAVGQLAAGIAHDFNNLLTVIQSYTDLMLEDSKSGAAGNSELLHVRDAADRAAALTRQLLVFSRRQIAKPKPVHLGIAFNSIRDMLCRLLPERIRLEWRVEETLPKALADASNLEQAVMNLVINARDATPRHGVITVNLRSETLDEIEAKRHPKARAGLFVVISVSDTGTGMRPEVLAHIFEPFFTTKESGRGTGLGLSTVYGIVDQHEGWVEVNSKVDVGTTFNAYIPANNGFAVSATPFDSTLASPDLSGRGQRILIVEDDENVRGVACAIANRAGYSVTEAADGHAALAIWHKAAQQFDLILTDMEMPNGLNGVELVARLRRDKPGLKVILASGYSDQLLHGAGQGLGDIPLLLKPYSHTTLVAKLRAVLDGGGSSRAPMKVASSE